MRAIYEKSMCACLKCFAFKIHIQKYPQGKIQKILTIHEEKILTLKWSPIFLHPAFHRYQRASQRSPFRLFFSPKKIYDTPFVKISFLDHQRMKDTEMHVK